MKNKTKRSSRRTLILILYALTFAIFGVFLNTPLPYLLLIFLVLTLVLMSIYRVDCIAMAGNLYYGRGQMEKAAKLLRYAIGHNTQSPAAHLHYAIYRLRKGEAEEALGYIEKALGMSARPLMTKNLLLIKGSCLWVKGDIDAAIAHLEKMRSDYEYVNAQVLSTLGYLYILKGDLQTAETLSQAAIDDTPSSASAWDNLGQIRYQKNDLPRAREAFEKALEYKPDLPDSLYYMGLILAQTDKAEAETYLKRAQACDIIPLNTVTRKQIEDALNAL
jgi:tetratricopeptide (TPR) repeat protein